MRLFLVLACLFSFGCTSKVACGVKETAATVISGAIGTAAACKHPEKLKPLILKAAENLNFCPADKNLIGDLACAPLVEALGVGLLQALPADAECSGGVPLDVLKTQALNACKGLIPGLK